MNFELQADDHPFCECTSEHCYERLPLTVGEWHLALANVKHNINETFFVLKGHQLESDRVLLERDGYCIVWHPALVVYE